MTISGLKNGRILEVQDARTNESIFEYELEYKDDQIDVMLADDGSRIAVLSKKTSELSVFDKVSRNKVFNEQIQWPLFGISAKGDRVIFRKDSELVIVDVDSARRVKLPIDVSSSSRFKISGDGRFAAVIDEAVSQINIFDLNSDGTLKLSLDNGQFAPKWIAISKTGKWLAVCDVQGAIKVWNLERLFSELQQAGVMPESE